MSQCKYCLKSYVWPPDLQRHLKLKHPTKDKMDASSFNQQQKQSTTSQQQQQQQQELYSNINSQQTESYIMQQKVNGTSTEQHHPKQQQQQQQQIFQFKHPFTANISGPTSCGKTFFVKLLLQNCLTKVSPPPERIIWLYKRWQPLYDVIKDTVLPTVEFIQGIPIDLEEDSFLNPQKRNILILDDLMSSAPRILESMNYLQKEVITETFQSSLSTKICSTIKIQPKEEIVNILFYLKIQLINNK